MERYPPMPGSGPDHVEVVYEDRLAGTVARVVTPRARAASVRAASIRCEPAVEPYLVADPHVSDEIPDGVIVRDQVIVGNLLGPDALPRGAVRRLEVAGEIAVPELDFRQVRASGGIAPHDAQVGDVQMIVRGAMHAARAVMLAVRDHHAAQLVLELRLHHVAHARILHGERLFRHRLLAGLPRQGREDRADWRQVIAVPERQECDETARAEHDAV